MGKPDKLFVKHFSKCFMSYIYSVLYHSAHCALLTKSVFNWGNEDGCHTCKKHKLGTSNIIMQVKNAWSCNSTPEYAFMERCWVKIHWFQQTCGSDVLVEKLIFVKLVKNFIRKAKMMVTRARKCSLSKARWIQVIFSFLVSLRSILILSPLYAYVCQPLFPSCLPTKILYEFLINMLHASPISLSLIWSPLKLSLCFNWAPLHEGVLGVEV
jgi:hypothetical protein